MQGWIKIHRQITDGWLWEDRPFSKGQAWIDLIILAEHKDHQRPYKGEMKTYERGTVNMSFLKLSERWGWSRKATRKFISTLENAKMVTTKVSTNDTTITLVNYSKYQACGYNEGSNESPSEGSNEGSNEGNISKNVKNDKNGEKGGGMRRLSPHELEEKRAQEEDDRMMAELAEKYKREEQ